MHRGRRVPRLFLRELICTVSVVAYAAAPATALQIPTSFHAGFYGELTSRPLLDPGAGARSLLSVASVGEIRLDLGVRRPESTDSSGSLVGMLGASFQYNAWGGYPRQGGVFAGYQFFRAAEHGHEILAGLSTATSNARGEHVQYELSFGGRYSRGHPARGVLRLKVIVFRLPLFSRGVPKPPPLHLHWDTVDAGGVPANPRWPGVRGRNVDRMCRFSYAQMSETPLLIYRPECDSTGLATLNQPISPRTANHEGLSCGVKNVEPVIRGHVNWFVVNQTGRLRWQGYNSGATGDRDFDLFLEAPDLVTDGNVSANRAQKELRDDPKRDALIELEFNGEETAGLFSAQHGGELWRPLIRLPQLSAENAEYVEQNEKADRLFRDRLAVVTGLLGLDGQHDFHTELHPVFAFAIDVSHELQNRYAHAWLVLVRNMGNEGECSAGELPWVTRDSTRYVLEVPWKAGADSVVVDADSSPFGFIARRMATLRVEVERARAVRLVADLPRPIHTDSAGIVYGTLRLWWFHHGRPLPSDSGQVRPAGVYQAHRPDRDKHDFEPVHVAAFPQARPLCFTLALAETVRRDSASSPRPRPQTVLRDRPTTAPTVSREASCSGAGSRKGSSEDEQR